MQNRVKIELMKPESQILEPVAAAPAVPSVAEIFSLRADNVIAQIPRALKPDDPGGIHDLRVAIRRLRTAMRDLAPLVDAAPARRADKRLKQVAALAGAVRDHDVAIDVLTKLQADTKVQTLNDGLQMMIAGRRRQRVSDFEKLSESLSPDLVSELGELLRSVAILPTESENLFAFEAIGNEAIDERRGDFTDLVAVLYDPLDLEGHHKLRIAAKRLRYTVELFDPSPEEKEDSPSRLIAEMQDHLGDLHDCDIWIGRLRKSLKRHLKSGGDAGPEFLAAEWLLGEFVRRRAKNYREALELWTEWRSTGFLDTIVTE